MSVPPPTIARRNSCARVAPRPSSNASRTPPSRSTRSTVITSVKRLPSQSASLIANSHRYGTAHFLGHNGPDAGAFPLRLYAWRVEVGWAVRPLGRSRIGDETWHSGAAAGGGGLEDALAALVPSFVGDHPSRECAVGGRELAADVGDRGGVVAGPRLLPGRAAKADLEDLDRVGDALQGAASRRGPRESGPGRIADLGRGEDAAGAGGRGQL